MSYFVVLGSRGEYSDRSVHVCGIYTTREEAESQLENHLANSREYILWKDHINKKKSAYIDDLHSKPTKRTAEEELEEELDAIDAWTKNMIENNPPPKYEFIEDGEIVQVDNLNAWKIHSDDAKMEAYLKNLDDQWV